MNGWHVFRFVLLLGLFGISGTSAKPYTVCLDPGHSRATVGATGHRTAEYRITWQVAERLRSLLTAQGVRVVLTKRSADANVSNQGRAEIANRAHADLFLRLHCDAGADSGVATYYPDRQGSMGGIKGPAAGVIVASRQCAALFHPAMAGSLHGALRDRGLRTDMETYVGKKQNGALAGSIWSRVPVVLVEMCVLTNRHDEALIASAQGQERVARAIMAGVLAARQGTKH
jgi:N-acetylmuramoyl-L-alanine amidase